jgi:hypothetical protein
VDPFTGKRGGRSLTGQSARLWPGYVPVRARPVSLGSGSAPILYSSVRSSGRRAGFPEPRRQFESALVRSQVPQPSSGSDACVRPMRDTLGLSGLFHYIPRWEEMC